MNERAEYERPGPVLGALKVDPLDRGARFLDRIDERQRHFVESDAFELREKTMAEHLGSDTGAVGDEKCGALQLILILARATTCRHCSISLRICS